MTPPTIRALAQRMVTLEKRFGGFITNLPIRAWSEHAPPPVLPWLQGGDRMNHHGYAQHYARELVDRRDEPLVLVEVGILRGTGLAIWSELLPNATVIGLDIDTTRFEEALPVLQSQGAFASRLPEAYQYDQFAPGDLERILAGRRVDVYIDDGLHTIEAIGSSLRAFKPHLSDKCVGFVEDNPLVAPAVEQVLGPDWDVEAYGELTVFKRRTA